MLLPGFTLPIFDVKVTQYVLHLLTDFNLGTITDERGRCTTAPDIIFKSIDKLTFRLHALDVSDKRRGADKDLSTSLPTINSRSVRKHGVSGDGLVTTVNVKGRIR